MPIEVAITYRTKEANYGVSIRDGSRNTLSQGATTFPQPTPATAVVEAERMLSAAFRAGDVIVFDGVEYTNVLAAIAGIIAARRSWQAAEQTPAPTLE